MASAGGSTGLAQSEPDYIRIVAPSDRSLEQSLMMAMVEDLSGESAPFRLLIDLALAGDLESLQELESVMPRIVLGGGNHSGPAERPKTPQGEQAWQHGTVTTPETSLGGEPGDFGESSLPNSSNPGRQGSKTSPPPLKGFGQEQVTQNNGNSNGPARSPYSHGQVDPSRTTEKTVKDASGHTVQITEYNDTGGVVSRTVLRFNNDGSIHGERESAGQSTGLIFRVPSGEKDGKNSQPNPNDEFRLPLFFFWEHEHYQGGKKVDYDDMVSQPSGQELGGLGAEDFDPNLGIEIVINPGDGSWHATPGTGGGGVRLEEIPRPIPRD